MASFLTSVGGDNGMSSLTSPFFSDPAVVGSTGFAVVGSTGFAVVGSTGFAVVEVVSATVVGAAVEGEVSATVVGAAVEGLSATFSVDEPGAAVVVVGLANRLDSMF